MRRYDVIVVGAGPAGSVLAYHAAQDGADVLLLDRASFPRDKPCGGGVTVRAASYLPIDLAPVVEREVYNVRFTLRLGRSFVHCHPQPLTYMTQRRRLDAYLAQQAVQAGAEFRDGVAVRSVDVGGDGVMVRADGYVYHGRVVVGADGANGIVGRCTRVAPDLDMGVALEGNIPLTDGESRLWQRTLALDLGGLPGGYSWAFPKGDHLNVGVFGQRYYGPHLRRSLA
ncbi:MAG: NAD(P)/FAD-dependent oxidoreductase, partial [Dehalococcoidia bacterium]